jgi:hypothetical protein
MALGNVIDNLFLKYTASMLLLITLTFPDDVRSTHAAHRRLNRFMNDIRQRYPGYVWVLQPQRSGVRHVAPKLSGLLMTAIW